MMSINKKEVFMTRISKYEYWMINAESTSLRSHDEETKVGAILISNKSGAILAHGYNGFARGADERFLPTKRPDKYPYMIHAEENLIANCARHAISMDDCTLVCTLTPCVKCMRLLFQCGITEVICKNKYKDFDKLKEMKDIKIEEEKTDEGFYKLTYKV